MGASNPFMEKFKMKLFSRMTLAAAALFSAPSLVFAQNGAPCTYYDNLQIFERPNPEYAESLKRLKATIKAEMQKKGYVAASPKTAQLRLRWHFSSWKQAVGHDEFGGYSTDDLNESIGLHFAMSLSSCKLKEENMLEDISSYSVVTPAFGLFETSRRNRDTAFYLDRLAHTAQKFVHGLPACGAMLKRAEATHSHLAVKAASARSEGGYLKIKRFRTCAEGDLPDRGTRSF